MNKRFFWFIILFLILCSPITARAAYNVKCEYRLHSATSVVSSGREISYLTMFYVYVDESNDSYKLAYKDTNGNEKDGKPNTSFTDYYNYNNMRQTIKYADSNGKGGFQQFDTAYKNGNNSCPTLYSHFMGAETTNITAYSNYNGSLMMKKIEVSTKEISSDGGKTWVDAGENTSSDKIELVRDCTYGFLTDTGSETSIPVIFELKFEKQKNITKNTFVYNVYVTSGEYNENFKNVLGTSPKTLIYPLNAAATGGTHNKSQLYIKEETVKKIFDGTSCLDTSSIWLYDNGTRAGSKEYVVTHDKQEADINSLGGIYDGYSGTKLINAKKDYESAVKALEDALQKFSDNNWGSSLEPECEDLFGGIDSGTNMLVNNYKNAKNNLMAIWGNFDFKKGDYILNDFMAHRCAVNPGDEVYGCDVIPDEIKEWILDALNLVKYLALALVIVLGVLDFIKAAASGEADAMKKSGNSFLKRIIAVVILFLVPVIVELILNLVDIYGAGSTCLPQ